MNAMSPLNPFDFEGRALRVVTDAAGHPWFHAGDVCAALELGNPRQAIDSHVDLEDVQKLDTLTAGGTQQVNYVNESGLYALIFGSTKEAAKRFKRWVTSEVLPALRRTGSYAMPSAAAADAVADLPPGPAHRADYVVSATRGFTALIRAGRSLGLGQRAAARRANAATQALTGVNLAELLDAEDLLEEPDVLLPPDPAVRECEFLRGWLEGRREATVDVICVALGLPNTRASQMRVAHRMAQLGWVPRRVLGPDGQRRRVYQRPGYETAEPAGFDAEAGE
jgi:prophage antirepressor-like protein